MFEIDLTRLMSATFIYHFAFLAVSLAMFGMTVGAVSIYLWPERFSVQETPRQLTLFSALFALSILFALMIHLSVPVPFAFWVFTSGAGLFALVLNCFAIAVPFALSGVCVCLTLTKFPQAVNKLYAADLVGAAIACVLVIQLLNMTDGPTTAVIAAFLAAIGAVCFSLSSPSSRKLLLFAITTCLLLGSLACWNVVKLRSGRLPFIRLVYSSGFQEFPSLYEKWNSFSRIRVKGNPREAVTPFTWGLSSAYKGNKRVRQLNVDIDSKSGSFLTGFDGEATELDYLKYDIVSLAHQIRHNAKVLVLGAGGGRDVLTALAFNQKSVLGVELNDNIYDVVTHKFADFVGQLNKDPRVTLVNDEARSFVSRTSERFDIIQVSVVDTWAATASGAFALAENSLYTVESFQTLLNHLNKGGILSIARFYTDRNPSEIYRLLSVTAAALEKQGVQNARQHLMLIRFDRTATYLLPCNCGSFPPGVGIGLLLASRDPLSAGDQFAITKKAAELGFRVMLSPNICLDPALETIVSSPDRSRLAAFFPFDVSPSTDDCPYFFQMVKWSDVFNKAKWSQAGRDLNLPGVLILAMLSIILGTMLLVCIFLPLLMKTKSSVISVRQINPLCVFFLCIGIGFMLIEVSQMQRLNVFLGHPTYGLSVVLFSMLLFSGLGSLLSGLLDKHGVLISSRRMACLAPAFLLIGVVTPTVSKCFEASNTDVRICVAVLLLAPLGLLAGMAFPFGMKLASKGDQMSLTPWLWALNGAASVLASVLAVVLSMKFGISATFAIACGFYVVAWIMAVLEERRQKQALVSASIQDPEPIALGVR